MASYEGGCLAWSPGQGGVCWEVRRRLFGHLGKLDVAWLAVGQVSMILHEFIPTISEPESTIYLERQWSQRSFR